MDYFIDLVIVGEGQLHSVVQDAAARNSRIHPLASVPQDVLAGYVNAAAVGPVLINSAGGRGRLTGGFLLPRAGGRRAAVSLAGHRVLAPLLQ